ncbi:YjbQ family protein [Balneolaceae bacterium YR4-1]|uniref:YjbQ family protein n=1 Tax=Halalkalibaculum roseum TaxID=2709311 RepID=A0A6M1T123_9BACT|nr:secondary thiamine-phosphate synthase enzyme YjbQ [Halalkalibaculum roseum]NGP77254.1 YjbQ family protein [Halalkalibaculum roseum]
MDIYSKEISINSEGFSEITNITGEIEKVSEESGFKEGLIHIFPIGSTASISTIEYEPALVKDMKDKLEEFAPKDQQTRHGDTWGDDNGFSHMRATMMGPGITVPLFEGKPVLGTWQQVVIFNHDNRSRDRRIFLQVLGK